MTLLGSSGCHLRYALQGDYTQNGVRPCDGAEWNGGLIQDALQRPQREIAYIEKDVVWKKPSSHEGG